MSQLTKLADDCDFKVYRMRQLRNGASQVALEDNESGNGIGGTMSIPVAMAFMRGILWAREQARVDTYGPSN